MTNHTKPIPPHRKAFTLAEFASLLGKHRTYAYRMARSGRIKTIQGYGRELVAASEIDRILGETSTTEVNAQ
jgi:predicted site-specific integrase-resolvase